MFALIGATVSCEDYFNPDIDSALSEKNSYADYLSTRASVNGLYALLQDVMTAYVVNGELRGDLLVVTDQADEALQQLFRLEIDPTNKYLGRMQAYAVITNANAVLANLETLVQRGTTYDAELRNMVSETMVLRTWVYFYLLRTFDRVPYLTEDFTASGSTEDITTWLNQRSSQDVNIDDLIQTVNQAIPGFMTASVSQGHFFNQASTNALLGDMLLWKNDYVMAVEALQASVQTGRLQNRFTLDSDLENARWQNIFRGDESATDEIMTKVVFSKGEKQENELLNLFSAISPGGHKLAPTNWIIAAIGNSPRRAGTFKNGNEVGKYTRSLDDPFISDMPVILYRAADVHLMLAEAYNRMGHVDLALNLINNGSDSLYTVGSKGVRGRVALPRLTLTAPTLQDSILAMETLIMQERARELAFEGKRWFDILRIAKRRDDSTYIGQLMEQKYPMEDMPRILSFYNDKANWYVSFNH